MIEVLVPWLGGCPHRERAWRWVREQLPYPYRVGEGGTPWVKAHAVSNALADSAADVVVVHDADVWCEGLSEAVRAVENGAPWAIPHGFVYRLSESYDLAEKRHFGLQGGGIVVLPRTLIDEVPLDPRFVGWGQEDWAWGVALQALAGEPWRGTEPLVHFFHPPQERLTRKWGSISSRILLRRYLAARHDPDRMRDLIREPSSLDQPSGGDPPPIRVGPD